MIEFAGRIKATELDLVAAEIFACDGRSSVVIQHSRECRPGRASTLGEMSDLNVPTFGTGTYLERLKGSGTRRG